MTVTVSIFAPSSPFDRARFEAGHALLMQLGLTVRLPDSIRARHGFLAGNDEHRAQAFADAWLDPSVDVMLAARGGYGAHRLMPALEKLGPSPNPKLVVGFSDVTAIHLWLYRRGWPQGVHGPVVTQLGDLGPEDLETLRQVLYGQWQPLTLEADGPSVGRGVAEGTLVGGCLSVITPLLGTPYQPNFAGTIVLLEDVGEAPYRIDRQLTHMRLAGAFDGVAGIALGDFIGGHAVREGEPDVAAVVAERLGDLGVPVVTGLPFGHGRRNRAIPVGVRARLDADNRRLTIGAKP